MLEAVRQVLVVIDGNRGAVLLEHVNALLHEFVARVEDLPLLVPFVVAVLADDHHRIHGELVSAAPQCVRNRGVDLKVEFLRARSALIAVRLLIDVERDHFHIRLVPRTVARVADKKAVNQVLGVREISIYGGDNCDSLHNSPTSLTQRQPLSRSNRSKGEREKRRSYNFFAPFSPFLLLALGTEAAGQCVSHQVGRKSRSYVRQNVDCFVGW